ncbi:MAG: hypothetical protein Q9174_003514 [Haloplaca sp. 1 TL-2023]
MTDARKMKSVSLIHCNWLFNFPWYQFPSDLECLEIIDPIQGFTVRSDQLIKEAVVAGAIARFTSLRVLNIQNVGGPVCELLWTLAVDGKGKSIKDLRLHDQDIEGIDRYYRFRQEKLRCPFTKLLAHTCPDLEALSIDITTYGLNSDASKVLGRALGSTTYPWVATLVEMAQTPTLDISETFRSLRYLRFLRIRTPASDKEWDDLAVLKIAKKMGAKTLDEFRFVVAEPMNKHLSELREKDYNFTKFVEEADGMEWCVQSRNGELVIVSRPAFSMEVYCESQEHELTKDERTPWWMHLASLRRLIK